MRHRRRRRQAALNNRLWNGCFHDRHMITALFTIPATVYRPLMLDYLDLRRDDFQFTPGVMTYQMQSAAAVRAHLFRVGQAMLHHLYRQR